MRLTAPRRCHVPPSPTGTTCRTRLRSTPRCGARRLDRRHQLGGGTCALRRPSRPRATHHSALRALRNRLVGILHGCLRHYTAYNPAIACSITSKINQPLLETLRPWGVLGPDAMGTSASADQAFDAGTVYDAYFPNTPTPPGCEGRKVLRLSSPVGAGQGRKDS